jgi:hypothetical protein
MDEVNRECDHTSVSGDTTEERESERERVNECDYVTMSILVDRSQAVRIVL